MDAALELVGDEAGAVFVPGKLAIGLEVVTVAVLVLCELMEEVRVAELMVLFRCMAVPVPMLLPEPVMVALLEEEVML